MSGSRHTSRTTGLTPLRLRKMSGPRTPHRAVFLGSFHELFLYQYLISVAGIHIFMHDFADSTSERAGISERGTGQVAGGRVKVTDKCGTSKIRGAV